MKKTFLFILMGLFIGKIVKAQEDMVSASWIRDNVIENLVTPSWIRKNLRKDAPRLFLNDRLERKIQQSIENNPLAENYFKLLKENADAICEQSLLEREVVGRRLLGVSREAVRRIGTLALVYRINGDDKYLDRVEAELNAVSQFSDWNPSHFLDVAEMSYAVSLGLDWCGEGLSESTINRARTALREKALKVSLKDEGYNWWIDAHHNWNQVCHAGLSAAAIVLGDEHPELASKILSRAVNKLPLALEGYSPIEEFSVDQAPQSVTLDLREIFDGQLMNASRQFIKEDGRTLQIVDEIVPENDTERVIWRMMTKAEVKTTENGAILTQDNKELKVKINEPSDMEISVVSMDPPPLPYDKKIDGLKRVELQIPAYKLEEYAVNTISVTLQLQQ